MIIASGLTSPANEDEKKMLLFFLKSIVLDKEKCSHVVKMWKDLNNDSKKEQNRPGESEYAKLTLADLARVDDDDLVDEDLEKKN